MILSIQEKAEFHAFFANLNISFVLFDPLGVFFLTNV